MDWNAYNDFGGRSNYVAAGALPLAPAVNVREESPYLRDTGGRFWNRAGRRLRPALLRPPGAGQPGRRARGDHDADVAHRVRARRADRRGGSLGWLEREGIPYDLYAENQLDAGVLDLDRYRVLILDQHPEYWTRKMYDAVKAWVFERGGRLMYLGGNGLDCEVELVDGGRAARHLDGDQSYYVTNRDFTGGPFSFSPRRIERGGRYECPAHLLGVRTTLTGMGTAAPYRLLDCGPLGLRGHGPEGWRPVRPRDASTCGTRAAARRATRRTARASTRPPAHALLAKGVNPHEGGSEMVAFETPSGGAVFSTASISWICCLPVDSDVSTITANVIRRFAEHPLRIGVGAAAKQRPPGQRVA